ncbi:MAG: molybdopterin converting factor subunit 1 [Alphaproteobacteria bacterium]|nr:molybdopterin converting factor subunit 1 [Alphaproteobacteria bacterium]
MKLLYFAWLKQRIGVAEETVAPPAEVRTVAALVDWLRARGPGYAQAFADLSTIRVAVNQEFARLDAAIGPDDEVALFPPVTGG